MRWGQGTCYMPLGGQRHKLGLLSLVDSLTRDPPLTGGLASYVESVLDILLASSKCWGRQRVPGQKRPWMNLWGRHWREINPIRPCSCDPAVDQISHPSSENNQRPDTRLQYALLRVGTGTWSTGRVVHGRVV
jgi:hypothetical protein